MQKKGNKQAKECQDLFMIRNRIKLELGYTYMVCAKVILYFMRFSDSISNCNFVAMSIFLVQYLIVFFSYAHVLVLIMWILTKTTNNLEQIKFV